VTENKRPVEINISGIPVGGVGGLGLVAVAALMAYQMPEAWLLVGAGAAGGVWLAAVLIVAGRHRAPSGPSGSDPTVLFREAIGVLPEARSGEPDSTHQITRSRNQQIYSTL
jgi:hypothetical protein